MESYHVKSSIGKKETAQSESGYPNLSQKSSDYVKTCVISESSDSEEDKKDVRRYLHLNQYPNRTTKEEIKEDEKKQAIVSQIDCEHFSSDSATFLEENKEMFNDDTDIMPENTIQEDKHLWTPKKHIISNKQGKNAIISDSDTDSPNSKYSEKRLQKKYWSGPDIKLNLKDLGLNKQLGSWIEFVQQKPVMSTIPVSFL